eukprot:1153770-Pelagomonas_calceolata.AAC.7
MHKKTTPHNIRASGRKEEAGTEPTNSSLCSGRSWRNPKGRKAGKGAEHWVVLTQGEYTRKMDNNTFQHVRQHDNCTEAYFNLTFEFNFVQQLSKLPCHSKAIWCLNQGWYKVAKPYIFKLATAKKYLEIMNQWSGLL